MYIVMRQAFGLATPGTQQAPPQLRAATHLELKEVTVSAVDLCESAL